MGVAGEMLRAARKGRGLTQRGLGRKAGSSGPTIAAYESGAKDPRVATLVRLLAAADTQLEARPRLTRNEWFVDLMCDRLADIVLSRPELLTAARAVLQQSGSAYGPVWEHLLRAGPIGVVAALTSRHPVARALKGDTPLAMMGLIDEDERTVLLAQARSRQRAT